MKYFFTGLFALFCITASAGNDILVVRLKNSSQQMFDIQEPISIKEDNDSLYITSKHISACYAIKSIKDYRFMIDGDIANDILLPSLSQEQGLIFAREKNLFSFKGTTETTRIRVYSISGREQTPKISYSQDNITMDISSLPSGVYLIKFSGCDNIPCIKITKF